MSIPDPETDIRVSRRESKVSGEESHIKLYSWLQKHLRILLEVSAVCHLNWVQKVLWAVRECFERFGIVDKDDSLKDEVQDRSEWWILLTFEGQTAACSRQDRGISEQRTTLLLFPRWALWRRALLGRACSLTRQCKSYVSCHAVGKAR